jgi:cephalosporin hydroxylase
MGLRHGLSYDRALVPRLNNTRLRLRRILMPHRLRSSGEVVDSFHRLYFDAHLIGGTWADTHWLGVPIAKCPLDLWIYQEIITEVRPQLVIETGTYAGGSALFFASLFDLLGVGKVITVDTEVHEARPAHERITYLRGSSTDPQILNEIRALAAGAEHALVVLDSDHRREHVLAELHAYADLVTPGGYLIVEDTNVNGHPAAPEFGPGPLEAVEHFLAEDDRFAIDDSREKFLLTFNPSGFLRRR